jgi:hypothetical protein
MTKLPAYVSHFPFTSLNPTIHDPFQCSAVQVRTSGVSQVWMPEAEPKVGHRNRGPIHRLTRPIFATIFVCRLILKFRLLIFLR